MGDRGRWLGVVARVVPGALMIVLGFTGSAAAAIGVPGFVGSFGSQTTATSTSVTLGGAIPVGETLIPLGADSSLYFTPPFFDFTRTW